MSSEAKTKFMYTAFLMKAEKYDICRDTSLVKILNSNVVFDDSFIDSFFLFHKIVKFYEKYYVLWKLWRSKG